MTDTVRLKRFRREMRNPSSIQEMGHRDTSFGPSMYLKIQRHDGKPMTWKQLYKRFTDAYPEKWGIQMLPPRSELVDDVNMYHIFLFDQESPDGLNINAKSHPMIMYGSRGPYGGKQRIAIHGFGTRRTAFGLSIHLIMFRRNGKPLAWKELYEHFTDAFPEKWGIQMLPPKSELVDNVNWYHIFLFDQESPQGLNIRRT